MSVDSTFSAVDAAISGDAADDARKGGYKPKKQSPSKAEEPSLIPSLLSSILGNDNKGVPTARAEAAPAPAPAQADGMAPGVPSEAAPQTTTPPAEGKADGGIIKTLLKVFGF